MAANTDSIMKEVKKRRTFAIISHPDAGKTTLTEKLLLFGGAIRLAGSIKGRKTKKYAASDWMEMERQRGISITSSVLQFNYKDYKINILDTPGHQDFSEDTYRTLTAADSALMLIDMAKGVEAQTIKLFEVCRMQGIPIFTFINKLDRHGKDPLDLLDEIEQVLGISSCPLNWPVNLEAGNPGLYDRRLRKVELYKTGGHPQVFEDTMTDKLKEDIQLLNIAGEPFDEAKVKKGLLTPVFFGSAINGFGVKSFFDEFLRLAPPPSERSSTAGQISPIKNMFSGFIFKIQANMNPAHRDRIAFLRVCSGKFSRDMVVTQVRTGKKIKLSQPQQFIAQDRNIIEEAYPGDIIGIFDPGIYQIGDTLSENDTFEYSKLPRFSPEHFAKVTAVDAMKHKQFQKGLSQLAEEGAVQVYRVPGTEEIILGAVGELQFEVFEYRLRSEYKVDIRMNRLSYQLARWLTKDNPKSLPRLNNLVVKDENNNTVALFENEFSLNWAKDNHPSLKLYTLEEFHSLLI
jgi:peptide chain release factor 3